MDREKKGGAEGGKGGGMIRMKCDETFVHLGGGDSKQERVSRIVAKNRVRDARRRAGKEGEQACGACASEVTVGPSLLTSCLYISDYAIIT